MDLSTLLTAATTLKTVVTETIKGSDNVQYISLIDQLYTSAIDSHTKYLKAEEENYKLRKEVDCLNLKIEEVGEMEFRNNSWWAKNGEGPFCPGCFGNGKKVVRMIKNDPTSRNSTCPVCKQWVNTSGN